MRARLIPVSDLKKSMQEIWVDSGRRPFVTHEGAYIPVKEGFIHSHIIPERSRIGRGYQNLGDVVIFHGRKPTREDIIDVDERENPRGILWITGHEGALRKPRVNLISGTAGEVSHRESGIEYRLDAQKVMFSQGNREEKMRIASLVKRGEKAGDMFAGIGYFTLSLARAGALVHAMEINPDSFHYLRQNIRLNGLSGTVTAALGDCRNLITGLYDRIHMGHFEALSFLPLALSHTKSESVLHVHMLTDRTSEIERIIRACGIQAEMTLHRVKKAGPWTWHMVSDVEIYEAS